MNTPRTRLAHAIDVNVRGVFARTLATNATASLSDDDVVRYAREVVDWACWIIGGEEDPECIGTSSTR